MIQHLFENHSLLQSCDYLDSAQKTGLTPPLARPTHLRDPHLPMTLWRNHDRLYSLSALKWHVQHDLLKLCKACTLNTAHRENTLWFYPAHRNNTCVITATKACMHPHTHSFSPRTCEHQSVLSVDLPQGKAQHTVVSLDHGGLVNHDAAPTHGTLNQGPKVNAADCLVRCQGNVERVRLVKGLQGEDQGCLIMNLPNASQTFVSPITTDLSLRHAFHT